MRREREEWKLNFFDFFLLFGIRQSHLLSLCYKSISIFDWACDSSNESNWPIVVLVIRAGNYAHVMVQTMIVVSLLSYSRVCPGQGTCAPLCSNNEHGLHLVLTSLSSERKWQKFDQCLYSTKGMRQFARWVCTEFIKQLAVCFLVCYYYYYLCPVHR